MNQYNQPTDVILDFDNAPPAETRRSVVHVPRGIYLVEVTNVEQRIKKGGEYDGSDRQYMTVRYRIADGEYEDGEVEDMFSPLPPPKGAPEKLLFATRRFHALLLALGKKPPQGRFRFNLQSIVGARCMSFLDDNTIPAQGEYKERTVSRPQSYSMIPESYGVPLSQPRTQTQTPPAPAVPRTPAPAASNGANGVHASPTSAEALEHLIGASVPVVERPLADPTDVASSEAVSITATEAEIAAADVDDIFPTLP